ncbi:MAG: PD40 domain-containing protein [Anaerolineae bacterium]|nr:PD40 domain-containing protein [Anaerolineae bacterium]
MMKHTHLNLFMIIIFMVIGSLGIHAQTTLTIGDDEVLIYVKWVDEDGQWMYVIWHGSEMSTYQPANGECTAISPDGKYLAWSTEDAETLKIFDFSTMELLYQQEWDETWNPCYLVWTSPNTIVFSVGEIRLISPNFKFENFMLTELPRETPELPVYPSLPNFYPESKNNFILQNPTNPNIYFYERCLLGYIDQDGFCPANRMIIYDVATEQDIEIIEDVISDFFRGRDTLSSYRDNHYISAELASWSPDGRYLAYFDKFSLGNIGNLGIYDLQSDTYFEDVEKLYNPNINQPFRNLWLDNTTFVLWHTGLFWESTRYNSNEVLFVFAHADTQTYTVTDQPFDVRQTLYSPNEQGQGMLFVGKAIDSDYGPQWENDPRRGDLFYMSATTGEYTVIDEDVVSIITWRTLEEGEEWGE